MTRVCSVAYLSMHTSPLLQPGIGDAGGMNVYVDELARTMSQRGVEIDVFTRAADPSAPPVVEVVDGYRVHHVEAGPAEAVPVGELPLYVRDFAEAVIHQADVLPHVPDIIHSHYWLSGWAGLLVKQKLGAPLANSFHTLGRVKDMAKRPDEAPESLLRIAAEHEVIAGSDCVVAATPLEAEDLMSHYGAHPARLCISPPGVDHATFQPGDRQEARCSIGIADRPTILFVGRLQPLKGVDVAVEAFALLRRRVPDAQMLVIGGPSGPLGDVEVSELVTRVDELGLREHVVMRPPVPHLDLARHYQAADVLVLPSRSESFGLVAAEAQACGLPVVAADVGGLSHVVSDRRSGLLVDGWDPIDHAEGLAAVLTDHRLADRLSAGAVEWSERFSWDATARRFLELYGGVVARADGR